MKTRIITAACIFAVIIPIFYVKMVYGINHYIYILGFILTVLAANEIINVKEMEKPLPLEIHLLTYLGIIYLAFADSFVELFNMPEKYNINPMPFILIIILLVMILRKNYKLNDAAYSFLTIAYLGLAFGCLVNFFLQPNGMYALIFIIIIQNITDSFAFFVGKAYGKHKLCPDISPKKTVEGAIGGTIVCTVLVPIYAILLKDKLNFPFGNSVILIVVFTFFLSVIDQFGDLIASVIKRHFKVKDYSNLFPGHGGVLDRLDSILFTSLVYTYLLDLVSKLM